MTRTRPLSRLLLAAAGAGAGLLGCATAPRVSPPRVRDSAAERLAGLREATPELEAAAIEERFAPEEDKERRDAERAARADRQHRIEVMEKQKAKSKAK
jgi:hypothetical protein